MKCSHRLALAGAALMIAGAAEAQRGGGRGGNPLARFLSVDTNFVALTNVRVIDGTGAPARASQTVVIRDGNIVALGPAATTQVPPGARVIDLTGKSVIPVYPNAAALELAFARAGGLLIAGTDPTGGGGVIPGYSNQRTVELLVEAGFTPPEAIRICTLNGATFLRRADHVGSIAVGKQADLVVIGGDPSARIADIRNVEIVFKNGAGFDPKLLIESVKGRVGLF